jgi:dihydrofolate reductase
MRRIRYQVAASLDGYIAGPNGEFDWIVMDPDIDFGELFSHFDTLLMGRRTYAAMQGGGAEQGMKVVVFSRTLEQKDHPGVTIVANEVEETLRALRNEPGKDIWLFGGGVLFRSLLELGQVDTVEVAVIPILLGGGIPLLPAPAAQTSLSFSSQRIYEKSGIVLLEYAVKPASGKKGGARRTKGVTSA